MLKVLPSAVFSSTGYAKCGEIFCQSATDFTILCAFCEIKTFEYEDFLRHFRNMHFEGNLLKTEQVNLQCTSYPKMIIEIKDEHKEEGGSSSRCSSNPNNTELLDVLEEALESDDNANDYYGKEEFNADSSQKLMKWQSNVLAGYDSYIDDSDSGAGDTKEEEYKPSQSKGTRGQKDTRVEHKCEHCYKVYKTLSQFKKHVKREHESTTEALDSAELLACPECEDRFSSQRLLDGHCAKQHSGIRCANCGKRFMQRYYLTRHEETHVQTGVKNFICDYDNCSKRFYTRRRLAIHRRSHTAPKNFICDICGYSCKVPETLKVHYRSHTGEKPYACVSCKKSFASSSLLSEHKASHSTDRPHVCDVCGATFARQKALYHHKYLHLGVKKFVCKLCGSAFAQAAGLAGHMRKHKEEGFI